MWSFTSVSMIPILLAFISGIASGSEPKTLKQLLQHERDARGKNDTASEDTMTYFAGFHRGPQLKYTLRDQSGRETEYVENRIIVITWFRDDGRTALRYTVNDAGHVCDVRDVYIWALQASHRKQLEEEPLKMLRQLIPVLPNSTTEPPIGRTVYVSFNDKDCWRTETYDAEKLPGEFESVMQILGERGETRDRKK